ncbi:splicing factor 3B subunit 1-like [Dorcoceras hygrometricum]|uniref:Splicing factor 3B subunit 1-like n=1 Tax=Dorcoceras hygrometricum TaxID=472368 RepID=A0A2Z7AG38_9LAMI|nr:splicing factor 3B subunit 1-like [Dorcoceras hygrometricum]
MDHEGMISIFEALLASGPSGFLGCSSAIYEAALVEFFHNASVRDGMVVSTVQGKPVAISEELFAGTLELPLEGLTDFHEVPKDLVFEARNASSYDGKLLSTSCKKREMLFEFHLLNDILAKTIAVYIFNDMVTPTTRQARGYAVQICVLLKNAPDLELGESKEFPPPKILTAKTVGTYIAKNKNFYVDEDEPAVEKPAEKKKAVSKKRPATTVEATAVKKKRTTVGRAAPATTDLALVRVAQEAVPIQMISVVTPPAPKRKAPKRKLKLPTGSDDEIFEKEPDVVDVVEKQRAKTTDDDVITLLLKQRRWKYIWRNHRKMASFTATKQFLKEPLISREDDDMSGSKQPSKIIEPAAAEKEMDIDPVATEDLSLAKSVAMMTDSEESISTDSRLFYTTDDIPLGVGTTDDQILMPSALPAPDFTEYLVHLKASITQLSIKQLRTTRSIGDLINVSSKSEIICSSRNFAADFIKPSKDDKKSYYNRRDRSNIKMFKNKNNDRILLVAEESSSKWADTDQNKVPQAAHPVRNQASVPKIEGGTKPDGEKAVKDIGTKKKRYCRVVNNHQRRAQLLVHMQIDSSSDSVEYPLMTIVVAITSGPHLKLNMILESSNSYSVASVELPVPMKKPGCQRPKKIKPIRAIPIGAAQASILEVADEEEVGGAKPGGAFFAAEEGDIPDNVGIYGGSGAEEHYTEVFKAIHEQLEPWVTKFDEWRLLRTEVRLDTILSMTPIEELTKIEDDMMKRAEIERVYELMMRRELIYLKLVVELLEKSVASVGNEEQQAQELNNEQLDPENQVENNEETSDFAIVRYRPKLKMLQVLQSFQKLSDEVTNLSSQMAEVVDCLKELHAMKKGESSKKEYCSESLRRAEQLKKSSLVQDQNSLRRADQLGIEQLRGVQLRDRGAVQFMISFRYKLLVKSF